MRFPSPKHSEQVLQVNRGSTSSWRGNSLLVGSAGVGLSAGSDSAGVDNARIAPNRTERRILGYVPGTTFTDNYANEELQK